MRKVEECYKNIVLRALGPLKQGPERGNTGLVKNAASNISTQPSIKYASKDAFRILLAVVCILFASLASIDHESLAEREKAQARTQELALERAQGHLNHSHSRDFKRLNQPSALPLLQRISGSL